MSYFIGMIIFYLFNSVSAPAQSVFVKSNNKQRAGSRHIAFGILALLVIALVSPELKAQASNIGVNGFFSVDRAQQGSTFKGAVVLDIPSGEYVISNKPLGKYAVPTTVRVEVPGGFKTSPVSYPRATVRSFTFSAERLAVYTGKTILRFSITVPANAGLGETAVRVKVQYQSGSDKAFYSPRTDELVLPITIVTRDTPVKRINRNLFGTG